MQDELLKRTEQWLNNVKGWQLEGEKIVVALFERVKEMDSLKKQLDYADATALVLERVLSKAETERKSLAEQVRKLEEENTRLRERTLWPPGGRTWTVIRCSDLDRLQADNDNFKAQLKGTSAILFARECVKAERERCAQMASNGAAHFQSQLNHVLPQDKEQRDYLLNTVRAYEMVAAAIRSEP